VTAGPRSQSRERSRSDSVVMDAQYCLSRLVLGSRFKVVVVQFRGRMGDAYMLYKTALGKGCVGFGN
jgi:hypothetical protein